MPCRSAYLFIETDGTDVAAARIDHAGSEARSRTLVTYLPGFLSGPDARPVLPVGLALRREPYAFEGALPRFLSDLCPKGVNRDRLAGMLGRGDLDDFSALVYARNDDRLGALSVGQSERACALGGADRLLRHVERTRGIATTGLPGGRPKSTLAVGGTHFVATASDAESGTPEDEILDAYDRAGLPTVARTAAAGRPVLLARRFDREDGRRLEAVSAAALVAPELGYAGIAQLLRGLGAEDALPDLFLHAALASVLSADDLAPGGITLVRGTKGWGLAPTASVRTAGHPLPVAPGVPLGTLPDLSSEAHRFGLGDAAAESLCDRAGAARPLETGNLAP